jgi:hypothetical protein
MVFIPFCDFFLFGLVVFRLGGVAECIGAMQIATVHAI